MNQPAQTTKPKELLRFLYILYAALITATVFYWILLQSLVEPAEAPGDYLLVYILGALAAMETLGVLAVRFVVMARLLRPANPFSPANPDGLGIRMRKLRFWYIIIYVVIEAVALIGFVAGLMMGDILPAVPFFGVAIILFAVCYPKVPAPPGAAPQIE